MCERKDRARCLEGRQTKENRAQVKIFKQSGWQGPENSNNKPNLVSLTARSVEILVQDMTETETHSC